MKKNKQLLLKHLRYCTKKRKTRFGENDDSKLSILEENKKNQEALNKKIKEDQEEAKIAAERKKKKEKNAARWKLAGKIALGTAAVVGTGLALKYTKTGQGITSNVNNTVLKPVGNTISSAASTTAQGALSLVGQSKSQLARKEAQRIQREAYNAKVAESGLSEAQYNTKVAQDIQAQRNLTPGQHTQIAINAQPQFNNRLSQEQIAQLTPEQRQQRHQFLDEGIKRKKEEDLMNATRNGENRVTQGPIIPTEKATSNFNEEIRKKAQQMEKKRAETAAAAEAADQRKAALKAKFQKAISNKEGLKNSIKKDETERIIGLKDSTNAEDRKEYARIQQKSAELEAAAKAKAKADEEELAKEKRLAEARARQSWNPLGKSADVAGKEAEARKRQELEKQQKDELASYRTQAVQRAAQKETNKAAESEDERKKAAEKAVIAAKTAKYQLEMKKQIDANTQKIKDDQKRIEQKAAEAAQKEDDKRIIAADKAAKAKAAAANPKKGLLSILYPFSSKFGKSKVTKRLKQLCKKHGIRLTLKRNGKRVAKSQKTLLKQLKNKMR
jgi:hypothetical protein